MKILYAIQGVGNGHITRAIELIPVFEKFAEVDVLISGRSQQGLSLPFHVQYWYHGITMILDNDGGIDFTETFKKNKLKRFFDEIKSLPIDEYDFVVSDFEPIASWAAHMFNIPCYCIGNQFALLDNKTPIINRGDIISKFFIQKYAPCTKSFPIHFQRYSSNIEFPIIRKSIRQLKPTNDGHYTVYLPSYSDEALISMFNHFTDIQWKIFSFNQKETKKIGHLTFHPIDNELFSYSLASCAGVITNAGFGTTSEAIYFGKKLCIIPIKKQFEQLCNAKALSTMGALQIKTLNEKSIDALRDWLINGQTLHIDYPDNTELLVNKIFHYHLAHKEPNDRAKLLLQLQQKRISIS
jgi:uncharacterized protein (TIGR00661 family)